MSRDPGEGKEEGFTERTFPTAAPPFILWADLNDAGAKEWLVHNLIGCGEFSAWFGEPASGKSVLVEDLAIRVAAGRTWHGRATRRGAVLYIALERAQVVKRRAIAFRLKHGITESLPFALMQGVFDFRQAQTAQQVIQAATRLRRKTGVEVVLIVIDTFNRALCGGDENSPRDVGAVNAIISLIQEATGAHVLITHHQPKDGNPQMRGHGALLAAVDTAVHVAKSGETRSAKMVKANDAEEGQSITFRLESVQISRVDGVETTAPVVIETEGVGAAAAKQTRLTDAAKIALDALHEALASEGIDAPAADQIPRGVKVVTDALWRRYAYALGISAGGDRAKQVAFQRAVTALLVRRLVGCWKEHYWSVPRYGR